MAAADRVNGDGAVSSKLAPPPYGSAGAVSVQSGNASEMQVARRHIDWVVAGHYSIPRKVIVKSMEKLDAKDCPDRPGMVQVGTLQRVVQRFDAVFIHKVKEDVRSKQVAAVVDHLKRHTQRRRGKGVLQEGLIEWEQTSRIYELFCVDLNIFERIYFTVDVGESTSVLSKLCSFFLMGMIFLSIVVWMTSTLPDIGMVVPSGCVVTSLETCEPEVKPVYKVIEKICVYVFTLEYLVRVFTVHSVRFSLLNEKFLEAVLIDAASSGPSLRKFTAKLTGKLTQGQSLGHAGAHAGLPGRPPVEMDSKWMTMLKYVFGPANLVDLAAILPYWIELAQGSEEGGGMLMVLRVLRLTRVFRVFKLGQYNEVFTMFSGVVSKSMPAFGLMLFFIVIGCCLFGTLMWFCESGDWYPEGHPRLSQNGIIGRGAFLRHTASLDPDAYEESPFQSIIHSFWFVIVTITTVGYGDHYPTTGLGKIVGALTILNGIIVLAMPIGVLGANFSQEYYNVLEEKKRRLRLKQQSDTIAAVEEEQDAALNCFSGEVSQTFSAETVEALATNAVRQRILSEAEIMDNRWSHVLPQMLYPELSHQLRQVVANLLTGPEVIHHMSRSAEHHEEVPPVTRPAISVACLVELDGLGVRVHEVVASSTAVEDLADFGLREAHQCRRQWASFTDRCWEYVAQSCAVEEAQDPPNLLELKAKLCMEEQSHQSQQAAQEQISELDVDLEKREKPPSPTSEPPAESSSASSAAADKAADMSAGSASTAVAATELASLLPGLVELRHDGAPEVTDAPEVTGKLNGGSS